MPEKRFAEGQRVKIRAVMGGGTGTIIELSSPSSDIYLVKTAKSAFRPYGKGYYHGSDLIGTRKGEVE